LQHLQNFGGFLFRAQIDLKIQVRARIGLPAGTDKDRIAASRE
jgi:hypothetical protein